MLIFPRNHKVNFVPPPKLPYFCPLPHFRDAFCVAGSGFGLPRCVERRLAIDSTYAEQLAYDRAADDRWTAILFARHQPSRRTFTRCVKSQYVQCTVCTDVEQTDAQKHHRADSLIRTVAERPREINTCKQALLNLTIKSYRHLTLYHLPI